MINFIRTWLRNNLGITDVKQRFDSQKADIHFLKTIIGDLQRKIDDRDEIELRRYESLMEAIHETKPQGPADTKDILPISTRRRPMHQILKGLERQDFDSEMERRKLEWKKKGGVEV